MVHIPDDLYLGNFTGTQGLSTARTIPTTGAPTRQLGVGPMGRIAFHNIVPATLGAALVAPLHALVAGVPIPLVAGAGMTASTAPDGTPMIILDTPRNVTLTSGATLSGVNITITGYDIFGQRMTQTRAGPAVNTVGTTKAFYAVISVVPAASNAGTMSVGVGDVFGLPWVMPDAGYIMSIKWAGVMAQDAGTFVAADATSPATALTGDPRGTYAPTSASNGARRLIIGAHLGELQCGSAPTRVAVQGVAAA